jgi:adenylate cyclase
METGEPLIIRPDGSNDPMWIHTDLFEGRGLVEIHIVPLSNADGMVSAASLATTRPSGFATSELAALGRIVPALRNACELRTLRKVELTLLDSYIGATTAQRFLARQTRSAQVETLEAALMLCDLRGFIDLSERLPGKRAIDLLNACSRSSCRQSAAPGER